MTRIYYALIEKESGNSDLYGGGEVIARCEASSRERAARKMKCYGDESIVPESRLPTNVYDPRRLVRNR